MKNIYFCRYKNLGIIFMAVALVVCLLIFFIPTKIINENFGQPNNVFAETQTPDYYFDNSSVQTETLKVLTIRIDPVLTTKGGIQASAYMKARDAFNLHRDYETIKAEYINAFSTISHNLVSVQVVEEEILNEFPTYKSGKEITLLNGQTSNRFDEATWTTIMSGGINTFINYPQYARNFGDFDYEYLLQKFNLVERKNNNEFDMVWLVDLNDSGVYESCIVGRSSYWDNGENIVKNCDNFQIMALTLPRSETYLECLGHSAEFTLQRVFKNNWDIAPPIVTTQQQFDALCTWYKFLQRDFSTTNTPLSPGFGVAGNVHYAPNSKTDYEWSNTTKTYSTYEDWLNNYPNLSPVATARKQINYNTWKNLNSFNINLAHKIWWFQIMPHTCGRDAQGFSNNWWDYLINLDWVTAVQNKSTTYKYKVGDNINNIVYSLTFNSGKTGEYTLDKISANTSIVSGSQYITISAKGEMQATGIGQVTVKTLIDNKEILTTINIVPTYNISWHDGDGNLIIKTTVMEGEMPVYNGLTPTKSPDNTFTYTFKNSWTPAIVPATKNASYTAEFTKTYIDYMVQFVDYDNTPLTEANYHYNAEIIPPQPPTRQSDNTFTYTFKEWSPTLEQNVTNTQTYKAVYEATYIEYVITFQDDNGSLILRKSYHYGDVIADITHPFKPQDDAFTYAFSAWDSPLDTCTGNKTFTAVYTRTLRTYAITFILNNGNWNLQYTPPAQFDYEHETLLPTAENIQKPNFEFLGWTESNSKQDITYITKIPSHSFSNKTFYAKWKAINDVLEYETSSLNASQGINLKNFFTEALQHFEKLELKINNVKICFDKLAINAIAENEDIIFKFSISTNKNNKFNALVEFNISLNGINFQDGCVTITYFAPELPKNLKVFYVDEIENLTDMNATYNGENLIFQTNHFSKFVVIEQHKINLLAPFCAGIFIILITILICTKIKNNKNKKAKINYYFSENENKQN